MKTTHSATSCVSAILLLIGAAGLSNAPAALVLYEGFDYGGSSGSLVGLGSTGNGWTGSWSSGSFTYTGSPTFSESYDPTGLTFSTLSTTGGRAVLGANGNGGVNVGRVHSATITGSLYGSYLYRSSSGAVSTGLAALFEGGGLNGASNGSQFSIEPDAYISTLGAPLFDNSYSYNSGAAISANETYLVLYKLSNLGSTATSQSARMWMLRESQYANFVSGGITETELDSAALGTGATEVLQRGVDSTGSTAYQFLSGNMLLMQAYSLGNAQFDELRISDAGFDDLLTTVPEPGRGLLLFTAVLALATKRRRP